MTGCRGCGSKDLTTFYRALNLPGHSCLLMRSRQEALDYPKGDLELSFCNTCGFIQNTRFDASLHDYSPRYEETQAFSPRFVSFARDLARSYIHRYDLRDKTVLEIGCGKGEFLVMMCEEGPCRGIGIDPGYRPERTTSEASERIEFIQDFYSEQYSHLQADAVLCRHTLEHIPAVQDFMTSVRNAIGDKLDTIVCFELPDMERILRERAFWDIYYEHCSYFTLGSLARLFRGTGFRVERLERVFGDQYLLIDAWPANQPQLDTLPEEESVATLQELVGEFGRSVSEKVDGWRGLFAETKAKGETVVLWGSGSKAVSFLTTLQLGDEVHCVTDINPHRHGMFMPGSGHEIVPPEDLKTIRPDLVIAMNPIYTEEIRADLEKMGLQPRLLAV